RTLHDVDALDLFGADVVEEARTSAADVRLSNARRRLDVGASLLDAHTVDDHERIVRERSGADAANADACATANGAVRLGERYTGCAAVQHILHCGDRLLLHQLRGLDL